MQKIKIRQIIASTILLCALAPQGKQIAQEMPPLSLLALPCVNSGIGNWASQTQDVSVGRALYQSMMYMGPGDQLSSLTCRLQPNQGNLNFQTLNLQFGMRDNDKGSPPVEVNLYIDGVKANSQKVAPGEQASISMDVTTTKNIALEAVCSELDQYCSRVYFWDASLEVVPPSPEPSS